MKKQMPRRLEFALRIPGVPGGKWLDVGAGIGHYLQFMPSGSLGLDIKADKSKKILYWNFLGEFPEEVIQSIDVVWCSNLIEHVIDPHKFLISLRSVFSNRKDSTLLISCPNSVFFKKGPWRGTLASDHVNFFTLTTLRLTLEFAGYEIVFAGTPSFPRLPFWISRLLGPFGPTLLVAARPIPNFQYGQKAHKILLSGNIIEFKDESISDS
jgi:SAM-dependent methyltransferase